MYSVSADYLTALSAPVKKFRLTGSVGSYSFTQANIIENTFSIVNRVSEGSEVKLGSVYIGQLKATFTGLNIARGAWLGKVITVSEGLQLADESYEDVPLGIYTIAEANHTQEGVEVVAYDNMNKLDKRFGVGQTNGSPYALLSMACSACSLTLGMTENQIRALTNGTATLYLYDQNDIETFRDFVSWIAQTLCAVATISRDGKLVLRQYSTTSAATIDENHRFMGCSFSDYAVKYTGCYVNVLEDNLTRYAYSTPDDGLTINLGSNPFMQLTGVELLQQNLINAFATVSLVPFSATMLGGAIYDLCDCLTFSGGIANGAVVGIMSYAYSYNRGYKIEGYGKNPDLANARSKTDKDITGLIGEIDTDKPRIFAYTNADAITIADGGEQTVAYIHVVAKKGTRLALQLECNHTAVTTETENASSYTNTDLLITSKIYVNNVQESFEPVETEQDGKQGLFVTHSFTVDEGGTEIQIDLACAGGNISVAVGDIQAYVIGMGLTDFVMTDLELGHLPTNLFNYGKVNYYGLVINGVFNDSSVVDKTDDCTITPTEGTAIAGDAETVSFTATYEDFEVNFDAPVQPLFKVYGQGNGQLSASVNLPTELRKVNDKVLCLWESTFYENSLKYLNVGYRDIVLDGNGRPTYSTLNSYWRPSFTPKQANEKNIDLIKVGNKFYADACTTEINKVEWFDLSDFSSGTITPTIHDPGTYGGAIEYVRVNSNAYMANYIDGYIVYPKLDVKVTGYGTMQSGVGYGVIGEGTVDIYVLKENAFDVSGTWFDDVRVRFSGSTLIVEKANFNTLNLLSYTQLASIPNMGGYIYSGSSRVSDTDLLQLLVNDGANKKVVVDTTNGAYKVFDESEDGYKYIQERTTYDPTQEVYITMARDTTAEYTYRSHQLWFSYDLVNWFLGGYFAPVGNHDTFDLNTSSYMVADGDYFVGAVSALQDGTLAFSMEFLTDIGA